MASSGGGRGYTVVDDDDFAVGPPITPIQQVAAKLAGLQRQGGGSATGAPKGSPFKCDPCSLEFTSGALFDEHMKSKLHAKNLSLAAFKMDERDMYVDPDTPAYKAVMQFKGRLTGCEYIVLNRADNETRCLLCKSTLKDINSLLQHIRSKSHIHSYVSKHYPEVFRHIQRKAKSKQDINNMINEQADGLCKQYGKKEPLVYEKGYYVSLSSEAQTAIDRHLAARRREMDDQRKCTHPNSGALAAEPAQSASSATVEIVDAAEASPSAKVDKTAPHRRKRTRSPVRPAHRRSRSRSRSRSRARRRRSRSRSRSRESRQQRRGGSRRSRSRSPGRRPTGRRTRDRSVDDPGSDNEASKLSFLEDMDELPTEHELLEILCAAPLQLFAKNDQAYVQDLIDSIPEPAIGVHYLTEYSDPRGTYEPGYLCTLCQTRMNARQTVRHVFAAQHQLKYIERHHARQHAALQIQTLLADTREAMKTRYVAEIAQSEPSRRVTHRIALEPHQRTVFRHHKRMARPKPVDRHGDKGRSSAGKHESIAARKPTMVFSERAERIAETERRLPPNCEWNYDEGWYSARKFSIDYYRRLADPEALYFSLRDPHSHTINPYLDWNPQLLRRLQDKFNFKLEHVRWLQKLLAEWNVNTATPLTRIDLKPLEEEVEVAVLDELLGNTLKPVDVLRGYTVIEYQRHPEDTPALPPTISSPPMEVDPILTAAQGPPAQMVAPQQPSSVKPVTLTLRRADEPKPKLVAAGAAADVPPPADTMEAVSDESDLDEPVPDNDKDRLVLLVIDQLLAVSSGQRGANGVLDLIVGFKHARSLLFRLAVHRPAELHQLVELAKKPVLNAPEPMLVQLKNMLQREAEAALTERRATKPKPSRKTTSDTTAAAAKAPVPNEEVARRARERELTDKIDQARLEMMKKRRESTQTNNADSLVRISPPPDTLQGSAKPKDADNAVPKVLTPKLPSALPKDTATSTPSTSVAPMAGYSSVEAQYAAHGVPTPQQHMAMMQHMHMMMGYPPGYMPPPQFLGGPMRPNYGAPPRMAARGPFAAVLNRPPEMRQHNPAANRDLDRKNEETDKKLYGTEKTSRAVQTQTDATSSDLRIMNVSRKTENGDTRDAAATFRLILSEGLGFDVAATDAICDKYSLQRAFWRQQRSRAHGGGRGGAAAAAGAENFVLIARLTNQNDVIAILKAKCKERFRDFKLGCPKPVGIDRNYTSEGKCDRNRAIAVARALCEKKGWDLKKDIKMKGKAFEAKGVTKTYEQWLISEKLTVDPAKMGDGWAPPKPDRPSAST